MQLLSDYTNNLDSLLDKILEYRYKIRQITFDKYLCLSVSTVVDVLYLVKTKDIDNFIEYRLKNYNKLNKEIFKETIPKIICKKEKCILNSNTFFKMLEIPEIGKVKLLAKPDAFYNGYPVEIKALSIKNGKISHFLENYGRYQAEMYGYVLGTELAYLIIGVYTSYNEKISISSLFQHEVKVKNDEMNKEIKNIIKEDIFPYIKNKLSTAAGGI